MIEHDGARRKLRQFRPNHSPLGKFDKASLKNAVFSRLHQPPSNFASIVRREKWPTGSLRRHGPPTANLPAPETLCKLAGGATRVCGLRSRHEPSHPSPATGSGSTFPARADRISTKHLISQSIGTRNSCKAPICGREIAPHRLSSEAVFRNLTR